MRHFFLALALLPAWNAASAQENRDIRIRLGLGAQYEPKYVGADKNDISPLFNVKIARGANEFRFSAPDDNPSLAVVQSKGFALGVTGKIAGRRRESDVGAAVGNVGRTLELGAFVQYEWQDSFRIRAALRKGVDGHKGVVGDIGADKIWRDGDRYVLSLGPRALFSDGRFERTYFGVTPAVAIASGLPAFRPSSGIYAVGGAAGATYALNEQWGLMGYARYERLVGDAAKSPIIRTYGSRDQFSVGAGLTYTFVVHRTPKP